MKIEELEEIVEKIITLTDEDYELLVKFLDMLVNHSKKQSSK